MSSRNFEDLPVWKDARELCRRVYAVTHASEFRADPSLTDQIRRAAVSVVSNVAEGVERGTTSELIYFLFVAKGSVGEVRAQLYVAEDQRYVAPQEAAALREQAKNISYQLDRWIRTLQRRDAPRGPRYRQLPSEADKRWAAGKRWLEGYIRQMNEERRQARENGEE
ncbi:MAG: four helix bundle protein [Kiritimatiellaeota bacterium]|nr:four helix bundle protein [Kiritimatiellota bacterium]